MKHQVLRIEQMIKLKELRIDVIPRGNCLMYTSDSLGNYYLKYGESTCVDDIRAFSLQDIIDLLPTKIELKNESGPYRLEISAYAGIIDYTFCSYTFKKTTYDQENNKNGILNAAYEMLVFLFENRSKWGTYRRFKL